MVLLNSYILNAVKTNIIENINGLQNSRKTLYIELISQL